MGLLTLVDGVRDGTESTPSWLLLISINAVTPETMWVNIRIGT